MAAKFKSFFNEIYSIMESVGRARAATILSQKGYYKEARELMLGK